MKFLASLLACTLLGFASYAQNCSAKHPMYQVPSGKTPTVLVKLGTSPEFPPLQDLNSVKEVFHNLKAMGNIAKYKDAINGIFVALGYKGGVGDPEFTIDDVTPGDVPFGAIGMCGDANHHYLYSILVLPGQEIIKSWHINSNNGCDIYFMSRCGNVFYMPSRCNGNPQDINVIARYKHACDCDVMDDDDAAKTVYPFRHKEETETTIIKHENANRSRNTQDIYIDVDKATFRKLKHQDTEE